MVTVKGPVSENLFTSPKKWAIPEKKKQGGWGYRISRGIKEVACLISRVNQKRSGISRGDQEKSCEFPGVLVFSLGISKGCNTILQNFQAWSFVLIGISRGKVKNEKFQGGYQKSMSSNPPSPCLVFSGIAKCWNLQISKFNPLFHHFEPNWVRKSHFWPDLKF